VIAASGLTIGRVAKETGVPPKTIRYYESIGLLSAPKRTANGYRVYDRRAIEILKFVKRARELGFPVEEVAQLLALWSNTKRPSAEVKALAARHIARVEMKIAELESLRRVLTDLSHRCHGDARPDCPILDELAGESHQHAHPGRLSR
jgi:MerR family copper efflux transcriptional regulator